MQNTPITADPSIESVRALRAADLLARYRVGVEHIDPRLLKLTDAQLDTAFLPRANVGLWPARVLVGHVADAEMLFLARIRKVLAEDNPLLALWDEHAFIDSGIYGTPETGPRLPIAGSIALIHTLRRWAADWLTLVTDAQWSRTALHPERGTQTARDIFVYLVWHLEHHASFLNRKVDRLLGPS